MSAQNWHAPTPFRGAAILANKFFRDRVQSQTLFGYDIEWADSGPTDYSYYLADANFNVIYNPAIPSNLGRTPMPRPGHRFRRCFRPAMRGWISMSSRIVRICCRIVVLRARWRPSVVCPLRSGRTRMRHPPSQTWPRRMACVRPLPMA